VTDAAVSECLSGFVYNGRFAHTPTRIRMSEPARSFSRFDRSIVEGPIGPAVWKLAWPTMLQNVIGGLQGIVDHVMVGHYVGYVGNAAIGVSWQIFLVVIVFIASLYTGMAVLVARFAGANEPAKANRTVYQAFLTSVVLSVGVLAPLGYFLAPSLLSFVNAAPEVEIEALPYLRIMFVFSFGMLMFFMLGGALRSAGDPRTPLRLGVLLTGLNIGFNVVLIRGLGPIPAFGTRGAAMGTVLASGIVGVIGISLLFSGHLPVTLTKTMSWRPDWAIIRSLFKFGLPTGFQGVAMNVAGVLLLRFIGSLEHSAEAQAAYAVGYTELFSLVAWTSAGLLGATAAVSGQNLGAGRPERSSQAVHYAARFGLIGASAAGLFFLTVPRFLLGLFGMDDPIVLQIGAQLLRVLALSGIFVAVALTYTGGLQGTGDTRSPLYISIVSQIIIPLGLCAILQATRGLHPMDIWVAILLGHVTRCTLSVLRFRQEKWRHIVVDIEPANG
jgi:putative MATE family efflux protein